MAAAGKRHPLLIYTRLYRAWRNPALLIAVGTAVLWWLAPPPLDQLLPQSALLAATVVSALLYIYTVAGERLTYVRCTPGYLRVSTPLYRLAISYDRIHTSRPVRFSPADIPWTHRWLVEPFLGHTALALDLRGYPVSLRFLRLWFNRYVLPGDFLGLLFITPDWMALSREIEVYRGDWKTRRRTERNAAALTSITPRRN